MSGVTQSMKSCPVIVTEGEEVANHHSTAF
jgi:hypothetical protein